MKTHLVLLIVLVFAVVGCSPLASSPTSAPAGPSPTREVSPTSTIPPSPTPAPTTTPKPIPTPTPTVEPLPLQPELEYHAYMSLLELADILHENKDFAGAIVVYSERLAYQMSSEAEAFVYTQRADAYDDVGEFEAAIADYVSAIELGEQAPEILNNLCWDYGITGQNRGSVAV